MTSTPGELADARSRIAAAYDPELLAAAGQRLVSALAEHFQRVQSRQTKVLPWHDPAALVREAARSLENFWPLAATGTASAESANPLAKPVAPSDTASLADRVEELVRVSLVRGQNLHHPRYVGHQVPAPVPLAALFDLVGSITNQVMAIYEMGPWATAVEHAVVAAVGQRLGFPAGQFGGLVTSGGSLANLTALLTARNVSLGDAWNAGLSQRTLPPVLVAHADAHYSVARAAGILGLGTRQIVRAALDERRRLDPNRLDDTLADLRKRGTPIVAVSAAACATPIGAFDPLVDVTEVCRRHEVWLHVDAAHGGAACFSARHRHLLAGLAQADSVVCDAHKMMFVPALCAMVFYRNPAHRFATFHQDAPYLFDSSAPELVDYDSGIVSLECTKRAAAFGLWGIWSLFGEQLFADLVDVTFDLGRRFYELLRAADDFEALHEPDCNIVAFRHLPAGLRAAPPAEVDAFQLRLRRAVVESGRFYLVQTKIDGRSVLRVTIINPLTTIDDLAALLDCLREMGQTILKPPL
jgi:L-2,4-diaminobutyrate decarboxylase